MVNNHPYRAKLLRYFESNEQHLALEIMTDLDELIVLGYITALGQDLDNPENRMRRSELGGIMQRFALTHDLYDEYY